ncbi:MAG: L,D-transpeptidase [Alphaproteobacteria bacterium]
MTKILVTGNTVFFNGKTYRCAIGRSGFAPKHQEGDGITPVGIFPLRECWYRADKMDTPETGLRLKIIQPDDGWCDDPKSLEYNRHVKLPFAASHENLWRDDDMYDLIVPMGYNDDPIVSGLGSAIFLHVAKPDYSYTEGCVALAKADLLEILPNLDTNSLIEIKK